MIVVYTSKITPRLKYIFKHVFNRMLHVEMKLTSTIEEFIAHNGPKINYSKTPLSTEFFVRSHDLLFEQGINDIDVRLSDWEEVTCFFPTGKRSEIPYDIFAASFYLLTRYEEYLPQRRDRHDRYPYKESLAFANGFLNEPVVDIWVAKFKEKLKEYFPEYDFPQGRFSSESIIEVDKTFKYLKKGGVRIVGGFLTDLFSFKLRDLWIRILVLTYVKKDPFDTFDVFIAFQRRFKMKTTFFYLIEDYTSYDKNISFTKQTYQELIKSNSDFSGLGLLASYYTMEDQVKLIKQKKSLEEATHWPINKSKQYYTRLKLPEVYEDLIDAQITRDYSMGYEDAIGFRASTCTPFYFYNLDFEIQTPLKLKPYYFNDRYFLRRRISPSLAFERIVGLFNLVKKYDGFFPLVFHSDTLSYSSGNQSWKRIYEDLLKYIESHR